MKISTEIKAGIIGLVAIGVLIWGINYLKGRNILRQTLAIYALYQDASGLETSAPVYMDGIKIGYVDEIRYFPANVPPVTLLLQIEKNYPLPLGSLAELFSADLMGTRAIRIISSRKKEHLKSLDTITTRVVPDMFTNLQSEITPVLRQIKGVANSFDSLAQALERVVGSESLGQTIDHMAGASNALKNLLEEGGSLDRSMKNLDEFSSMLNEQDKEMVSLIQNLNEISQSIKEAEVDQLLLSVRSFSDQFSKLLAQVNSGGGSAGKLFYSDSLVLHLETLTSDLDLLIRDLQEHPERYVRFSVFGGSKKQK